MKPDKTVCKVSFAASIVPILVEQWIWPLTVFLLGNVNILRNDSYVFLPFSISSVESFKVDEEYSCGFTTVYNNCLNKNRCLSLHSALSHSSIIDSASRTVCFNKESTSRETFCARATMASICEPLTFLWSYLPYIEILKDHGCQFDCGNERL